MQGTHIIIEARTWKTKHLKFSVVLADRTGSILYSYELDGDKQKIKCCKHEHLKKEFTLLSRYFYSRKDTTITIFEDRFDMGEFYIDQGTFSYDKYVLPMLRDRKINQILK